MSFDKSDIIKKHQQDAKDTVRLKFRSPSSLAASTTSRITFAPTVRISTRVAVSSC